MDGKRRSKAKWALASLAVSALFAAGAFQDAVGLQFPPPDITIQCSVDFGLLEAYSTRPSPPLRIWDQGGRKFSMDRMFVSTDRVTLYLSMDATTNRFKFVIDGSTSDLLGRVCREDIGEVLQYIRTHEFANERNLFYRAGKEPQHLPVGNSSRVGSWLLLSWNDDRSAFDRHRK